jgi:hypothetical protein
MPLEFMMHNRPTIIITRQASDIQKVSANVFMLLVSVALCVYISVVCLRILWRIDPLLGTDP